MSSSVKDIIKAADGLARPFYSGEINEMVGDGTRETRDRITSVLCYMYKRCVLERVGKKGKSWRYAAPPGLTVLQAHKRWLGDTQRGAIVESIPQRKVEAYPMPPFPLGGWRSKRAPVDPERFVRGGM